jgi:hypothetical protein
MECDIHTYYIVIRWYTVGMYVTLHRILKPSYDYIVGMYVTLHRILKPSYDYIVGMYVTLHRILKPSVLIFYEV